jgi:recombination protein RecA
MSAPRPGLDRLLASGQVRYGRSVARRAPAEWGYAEVAGRFVEIGPGGGEGASCLTVAAGLVRDAQAQREPVAWIAPPASIFYPPDLADHGVDLAALAVVRPPDLAAALRAADELLRSAAFGLVVLDRAEPRQMPMPVQVRLANLAQQHDAAFVCLCREVLDGSLASLRLTTFLRRLPVGPDDPVPRFEYGFEAVKDKRRGRRWTWRSTCSGPPGL